MAEKNVTQCLAAIVQCCETLEATGEKMAIALAMEARQTLDILRSDAIGPTLELPKVQGEPRIFVIGQVSAAVSLSRVAIGIVGRLGRAGVIRAGAIAKKLAEFIPKLKLWPKGGPSAPTPTLPGAPLPPGQALPLAYRLAQSAMKFAKFALGAWVVDKVITKAPDIIQKTGEAGKNAGMGILLGALGVGALGIGIAAFRRRRRSARRY